MFRSSYVTHLMRRIEKGSEVRGISLKLQEEERERRYDIVPLQSQLDQETIEVDPDTYEMLKQLGFGTIPNLTVEPPPHP